MIPTSYRSSPADAWSMPRAHTDPCQRLRKYGRVQPMDDDRGLLWRLFKRR